MNENFDIQAIELALAEVVRQGKLSENIFEGQRPSLTEAMKDFVVVSVPTILNDRSAYGTCTARIELFVKNLSNGQKNSAKFSLLFKKLCSIFPIQHNTYLFDCHPNLIPLGNDNFGFHVQAININTLIKIT